MSKLERIPEPQLMEEWEQAEAYSKADFSQPHDAFVQELVARFGDEIAGTVLDLGCGPADVTVRMAKALHRARFHGVDGSKAMLHFARERIAREGLMDRIELFHGLIPDFQPPDSGRYSAAFINSLLHHLPDPMPLWQYLRRHLSPGAAIFLMDLIRPVTRRDAEALVNKYAAEEPEVLRRDFYNSLLAAFTPDEVASQLAEAGLSDRLRVEIVSDRHMIVFGSLA